MNPVLVWHECPRCRQSWPWKKDEIPSHICPVCLGKQQDAALREHIEIVGREKNELLDDLVFKAHDGPYKAVITTPLPPVTWRKP